MKVLQSNLSFLSSSAQLRVARHASPDTIEQVTVPQWPSGGLKSTSAVNVEGQMEYGFELPNILL
jgi:hypothetical protein